ncbi:HlyD family efflux transporter periplasmic adaptor subunit [Actibacterium sp. MT2.3-13A]|uniref:efflux RND transporter periplasmic adaptor subunit n=1 Tax=Actibacterium sp. MT2.3-13A TaxID=2828332 RepID=UPI001BACD861|nr:HlyD family efflux transporter periplasmic adaptor subunit [Actibacterium sp. MT2.3-13A]
MRFLRRSLMGLFLLAATLGLLSYAGQSVYSALQVRWAKETTPRPARERVFAVNVVQVQPQSVIPVLTAFGELRSRRTLDLRARASGPVVALHPDFEEGGRVQAGELLFRVDPHAAQSSLDVVRTDLAEAEAELRDASTALGLGGDELAVSQDQAALRAQALERQKNLLERGFGSDAAVETAALAAAAAQQAVVARRQALAAAQSRVDQARTRLERQKIALAEAERDLADTSVYAAFSGTLSEVGLVEGGLVTNNEQVAQLVDPDDLEVSFRVSTTQYARLLDDAGALSAAPLTVTLDVFGAALTAKGRLTRESAAVGEGQTGRLLFARLEGAKGFRPGDFVTVAIDELELHDVAVLPAAAVDAAGTVLVVGADDRLEVEKVELLRRQGDNVILRAPAIFGRLVVAERSPVLGAGIKVRPVRPQAAAEEPEEPEMVELSPERRAAMIAFIEGNQFMPEEAKKRVLGQLTQDKVPARIVERIESRMGG